MVSQRHFLKKFTLWYLHFGSKTSTALVSTSAILNCTLVNFCLLNRLNLWRHRRVIVKRFKNRLISVWSAPEQGSKDQNGLAKPVGRTDWFVFWIIFGGGFWNLSKIFFAFCRMTDDFFSEIILNCQNLSDKIVKMQLPRFKIINNYAQNRNFCFLCSRERSTFSQRLTKV